MRRITNIFQNRPNMLGQTQNHRRTTTIQRPVSPAPIVQIPPQPQCPLQHTRYSRDVASTPGQTRLLTSQCPIEPFQMRSIYLLANAQLPDTSLDVFQPTEQSTCSNLQQVASGIAELLDYSYQQSGRRPESGFASSTTTLPASAMFDLSKDVQDSCWIGQMLVDKNKRRVGFATIDSHRCNQFFGQFQGAWTNTQVYDKATYHRQRCVNPRATRFATRTSSVFRPFFGPSATRACNSSIWTASGGFSRRSSCSRWKSSARLPAFSSMCSTVRGSTSQMSAAASMEQPYPRHLMMRTTVSSG